VIPRVFADGDRCCMLRCSEAHTDDEARLVKLFTDPEVRHCREVIEKV